MNPLSLRATNYRTFESLELDLPAGCLAVVGENGAGKSSIVNVIDLALFGPEGRSLADYLTDDASTTKLEIELTFEHAGELYRVRRGFSAKGRGKTTLDFEHAVPDYDESDLRKGIELAHQGIDPGLYHDRWDPLTRESQKETQAAIEEVLGLSRETFRASAFLAQGDGAVFTEAQPRDRKRILADVLGLSVWERLRDAAGADRIHVQRQASELAGRISHLEESAGKTLELEESCSRLRLLVSDSESEHAQAERTLDDAAVAVRELEKAEATYRERRSAVGAADARFAERQAVVRRAAAAKLEAVEVQRQLSEAGDPAARISELEERRTTTERLALEWRDRVRERDALIADRDREAAAAEQTRNAIEEFNAKLDDLYQRENAYSQDEHPTCRECGQEIEGEAFQKAITKLGEEISGTRGSIEWNERILATTEAKLASLALAVEAAVIPERPDDDEYAALLDALASARQSELALAGLRRDLANHEATVALVTPELTAEVALLATALEDARSELAEIDEPEPGALDAQNRAALVAKAKLEEIAIRLSRTRTDLVRAESALEQAQKIAADLEEARINVNLANNELDLLALLERAYGRDGIPALIVESSAIPSIETEANRILAELGTSYRVELRTQKALKSGDGLSDTLDVVVIADAGERAYETFSGGERTRINLALRIALARLLAHRRGAESRLLAIDEPEFLDEAGTARLAEVLQGLGSDFDRIVLVSHVPTLRDAFDQTLEVVKDGNRSVVVA
jgi:exonuclease SbcC